MSLISENLGGCRTIGILQDCRSPLLGAKFGITSLPCEDAVLVDSQCLTVTVSLRRARSNKTTLHRKEINS
jgi:hypothetical protein